MVLGFKQFFDHQKTQPTYFREKILAGASYFWNPVINLPCHFDMLPSMKNKFKPKLHTIREGNRWKEGDLIHMAYGVRTKDYCQFNKGIPELERVKSVQEIKIKYLTPKQLEEMKGMTYYNPEIYIDGKFFRNYQQLAINDGFEDDTIIGHRMLFAEGKFLKWFNKDFEGQIVHWTELRY